MERVDDGEIYFSADTKARKTRICIHRLAGYTRLRLTITYQTASERKQRRRVVGGDEVTRISVLGSGPVDPEMRERTMLSSRDPAALSFYHPAIFILPPLLALDRIFLQPPRIIKTE